MELTNSWKRTVTDTSGWEEQLPALPWSKACICLIKGKGYGQSHLLSCRRILSIATAAGEETLLTGQSPLTAGMSECTPGKQ